MRAFITEADRLEAFSDGVIAVIITIMVLELKAPHGTDWGALRSVLPTFAAYVLSFVLVGIYWNNHHHMLRASRGIDGRAMWANLHLLFWLSLIPFTTNWLGENPTAPFPTALYGVVLLCAGLAYELLQRLLRIVNGDDTLFAAALRQDIKGLRSVLLYVCAIALAFVHPYLSDVVFVTVAIIWLIPDRRFEPAILSRRPPTT
jgi:uncharacterized membrane protein